MGYWHPLLPVDFGFAYECKFSKSNRHSVISSVFEYLRCDVFFPMQGLRVFKKTSVDSIWKAKNPLPIYIS